MFFADDRQSVFGFNGADVRLLEHFVSDFSAGRRKLTLSFRCGRQIVAASNALGAKLQRVVPDQLRDDVSLAEGLVQSTEFPDERAEAVGVVDRIAELLRGGLPASACHAGERLTVLPDEVGVLGRNKYALAAVEAELRGRFGDIFVSYDRDDAIASSTGLFASWLLRAVAHPSDSIVRQRLLESASMTGVASPSLSNALQRLAASANPLFAGLASAALDRGAEQMLVAAVVDSLQTAQTPGDDEQQALAADVAWLGRVRTQLRRQLSRDPTPSEFVREMTMNAAPSARAPGVRLMTIHAAKGLEFRVVVVVGLGEGIFPSYRAKSTTDADEERRLAYVAVTRASRVLLLSVPRTRLSAAGMVMQVQPSRFIAEVLAARH
jgi:DNA helicase-2/ATP-dependent DNA helicase PcrA